MTKSLILIVALVVITVNCTSWFPPRHDKKCGYTRSDALACVLEYGDLNHDGKLTVDELDHALDALVPSYLKTLKWVGIVSVKKIMKDCDYDKNGILTPRDWQLSNKTCMPKQEDLCKFKWFCDRQG